MKTSIGTHKPVYCTGLGKILLANQPDRDNSKIYDIPLQKYTENTITNHDDLIRKLEKTSKRGYGDR
ncbi:MULTISPECIES: IclR family transcriptional regulator C-terminal domain-containing protein [Neobacillus]|uniref:IclR family transcriptional regulator domain-containing protein n=1 Tax=Neobacillus driksii TaxID=3035913 RepID=UPI0015C7EB41